MDTLVIGLDGGEWDVINPMIEDGQLPTLARLKDSGVSGDLESIDPPVSPPAWSSIHTGKNPGKHGIFDFSEFDEEYQRRSINSTDRKGVPFWQILNDEGITTGLFKVPFTYPPQPVDGFIVTGFPTPSTVDDFARPETIAEEIGSPRKLFEDWSYQNDGEYREFKENLVAVARRQTQLFLDLIDEYDAEFQMTVYDGSDRIQHFFWKYFDEDHPRHTYDDELSDAILEYYSVVDRGLGRILERAGPETDVIVLSDHGFGPLSYDIRIDKWLEDNGYLSRYEQASKKNIRRRVVTRTVNHVWDLVRRGGLGEFVKDVLSEGAVQKGREMKEVDSRQIEWGESQAFFTTLSGQAIQINLEDRFTDGTVSRDEYEDVIERLRNSLLELENSEGQQIIENVYRSDELFIGPETERGPDVIVESAPEYTLKGGRADEVIEPSEQYDNDRSGDHRKNGTFVADGPSFGYGTVEGASILDIAPTILHLHGCAVPNSVDGSVLNEILAGDTPEVTFTSGYSNSQTQNREWTTSEQNELEDRLEDMGYL